MRDLAGRVAVVTGAASGIGRALAERLVAEGMRVVAADIDPDELGRTAAALGAAAVPVLADVASEDDVFRLAEVAYERCGAVHLLCANAGVSTAGGAPLWETTAGDWEWVLGVNLMGVVHAVRAFTPRMLDSGGEGHVVITASLSGLVSFPHAGPYGASKHAVVTVSEQLGLELKLRRAPIGVSVLCPAWVRTDILRSERHRPTRLRDGRGDLAAGPPRELPVEPASELASKRPHEPPAGKATELTALMAAQMAAEGLDPAKVADQVLSAVREGRFWVLPEGGWAAAVEQRGARIAAGEPPRLPRPAPDAAFTALSPRDLE